MFEKIADNLYRNHNGSLCFIAPTIQISQKTAHESGLDQAVLNGDVIVRVPGDIVRTFKKIELEERLNLSYDLSQKFSKKVVLTHDGSYIINGRPLSSSELEDSGIEEDCDSEKVVITYWLSHRKSISQNEIDISMKDFAKSRFEKARNYHVKKFCEYLLQEFSC